MTDIKKALQAASELIRQENVRDIPVDVRAIAAKRAHVLERDLDDDLSGMLVPLRPAIGGREWAIVVNKKHPEVRKRFTIAHELGHLVMHAFTTAHADTQFRIRLRHASSSRSQDIEEIQANRFAAELLMPEHLVVPHLDLDALDYVPGRSKSEMPLERLTKLFGVSPQALTLRIAHLLA